MKLNPFHEFCPYVSLFFSLLINPFLIYLILKYTRSEVGSYKWILLAFAAFDILYSSVDALIKPGFHVHKSAFIVFITGGPFNQPPPIGSIAVCIYLSFFSMSLAILSIHFLYRYIAIVHAKWLVHFNSWYTLPLCILYVLALAFIWSGATLSTMYPNQLLYDMMRESVKNDYDAVIEELGLIGPVYYYTDINGTFNVGWEGSIGIAIICFGVLGLTWGLIIYCGIRIHLTLKSAAMSHKVRELQMQLFKALIVQTLIPSVTNYMPAFVTLATPIFGIDIGKFNNYYSPVMVCLFPIFDPISILYFVKDYRRAVRKIFGLQRKQVQDESVYVNTTNKYTSTNMISQ